MDAKQQFIDGNNENVTKIIKVYAVVSRLPHITTSRYMEMNIFSKTRLIVIVHHVLLNLPMTIAYRISQNYFQVEI